MKFGASTGGASNPNIIKLKGGESVTGVLRGDPINYESSFKPGDKPRFQFELNMVVSENGAMVAKILRGGWKLYLQLKELSDAGWDLETCYTKISRTGTTQNDTVYSATPSPTAVPVDIIARVVNVKLHPLKPPVQQDTQPHPMEDVAVAEPRW